MRALIKRLPSRPELWVPSIEGDQVDAMVAGASIVGYHCTRLTDAELATIRSEGLQPLSRELIDRRISQAQARGDLNHEFAATIRKTHWGADENRIGRIAFIGTRTPFVHRRDTVHYLLGEWGGEAVSYALEGTKYQALLRRIGTPTIVVVAAPLDLVDSLNPDLLTVAWSAHHEPEEAGCGFVLREPVPPEMIQGLVQPGSELWRSYCSDDWRPFGS